MITFILTLFIIVSRIENDIGRKYQQIKAVLRHKTLIDMVKQIDCNATN